MRSMDFNPLKIRPTENCRWDCVALGEVMLRFDPGEERVRSARMFRVWEGGGEYNVARGLKKAFGLRSTVITALPRNELGLLASDLIQQGGVDTSHIIWRDHDGVGANTRMGLNFTERGYGVRPAVGCSDRANSAASQLTPAEIDWEHLFGVEGVRWLHTGGIFAALSPDTAQTTLAAVEAARRHGVVVSHDLNYRASLWRNHPDPDTARRINRHIVSFCDVLIGDEYACASCLGIDIQHLSARSQPGDSHPFDQLVGKLIEEFPNLGVVSATLREPKTASLNGWGAVLWAGGRRYLSTFGDIDIVDRVGGGDAFVAGLAYAFMSGLGAQAAVDIGSAHGALAMTTPGDNSMCDLSDVMNLVLGRGAAVVR